MISFNHSLIVASTEGIQADDATYLSVEEQIQELTAERDALVEQMKEILNGTANGHLEQLIRQGEALLERPRRWPGSRGSSRHSALCGGCCRQLRGSSPAQAFLPRPHRPQAGRGGSEGVRSCESLWVIGRG